MRTISLALAFAGLSACANSAAAPVSPAPIVVPMDLASGRPVIELEINGQGPFHMIMDTGVGGPGLMSRDVALALGLEPVRTEQIGSPLGGTPAKADVYRLANLSVGGATVDDKEIYVMTDDPLGGATGDGVIGPSLFDEGVVTLDFVNSTFEIGGPVPADAHWIPLGPSAPLLDASLNINGEAIPAHIDTGAPHVLSLPESYADTMTFEDGVKIIGHGRTIDREFDVRGATLNADVTIGDAVIPVGLVTFGPLPVANLGTGGLRGLVLTIDWPNHRYAIVGHAEPVMPQPRRIEVRRIPEDAGE